MKRYPNLRIQIQGNTDDRGSSEYNLALGERRAYSLKRFLVDEGVDAHRVTTTSFGKENPKARCERHKVCNEEEVWALNRRNDITILNHAH
jgi:peptidoglycan-associated lipoprotein